VIHQHLTDDPHVDASGVQIHVKDGEVTLTGTVRDKATKWRVEDAIESIGGVSAVHNQLRSNSSRT
jgi:osmotically-inducible protein OsmY